MEIEATVQKYDPLLGLIVWLASNLRDTSALLRIYFITIECVTHVDAHVCHRIRGQFSPSTIGFRDQTRAIRFVQQVLSPT